MYQSSIDTTDYVPFVEDGVTVGSVHWLSDGSQHPLVSGIWRAEPGDVPEAFPYDYPFNETIQVLEGSVTIDFADGQQAVLTTGDVVAVAQGTRSTWSIDPSSTFRKFFVCH
jgi:uncharacterized cupin superfamily protein